MKKSPSVPLFQRGKRTGSPLWKRGVRGDFGFSGAIFEHKSSAMPVNILLDYPPAPAMWNRWI